MSQINRQLRSVVKKTVISVFENEEILDKIAENIALKMLPKIIDKLEEQQVKYSETKQDDFLEKYFQPNFKENGIYTAMLIEELKGLDYGSGMAHSFFHGYLKLILPQSSSHEKSVKTNIDVYESVNNVEFATKKLYILIPLSAHCPNTLSEATNKIENGAECEPIEKDRAGVRDRVYKNTAYKLLPGNGETVYVMAEYATPLKTLWEAMSKNTDEALRYKRYKKEIVTNFFMTLDKLLREDPECRDYCHLIYFKDIDENGEHLQIDICDLILDRINYDLTP